MKKTAAIIVAAGRGARFGSAKQFARLGGKPALEWSLEAFSAHPRIGEIVLVLPDEEAGPGLRKAWPKLSAVVKGGAKRQDSVFEGFRRLDPRLAEIVLVHDGARPLVTKAVIQRVMDEAAKSGAAVPVLPMEDTVKEIAGGEIVRTLDRARLARVQTPQGFAFSLFKEALDKARADGFYGTDDAALVERMGVRVVTVLGEARNMKITSPTDMKIAEALLDD
ncbi:MAG: 2-C-methyl-D-erythritol 4-phosphate cytidylyltransferase [Candidatus Aminicenantales bacterium]|jgi:2-C-methyl-D-erythritol 4-phosphate cytidylyltransferase